MYITLQQEAGATQQKTSAVSNAISPFRI